MTERLYYADSHLIDFDASVVAVGDAGGRPGVVLDRTAFYPTSGGQPYDTGRLGSARVVDVIDQDDGSILHVVDGAVPAGRVQGRVDWRRRFEHMQQHTGQHVLSAAFDRLHGVRTVSFHLGSDSATVDLGREVSPGEIAAAEEAANGIVWEDRPVSVRFVAAEDAAALPLRKESARMGTLRIVEVDGFDVSACGGTHVTRTGAIGVIAVSSWERFRGGSRVEFRCGVRTLRAHRLLRDAVAAAARLMSVAPEELAAGVERLQAENKDARRRIKEREERLGTFEADAMAARAVDLGDLRLVLQDVDVVDVNALKTLAQAISLRPGHAVVLLTRTSPFAVIVSRASGVGLDAAAVVKQLTARFGGRGGGRPELAQAGGLTGQREEILAAARSFISAAA